MHVMIIPVISLNLMVLQIADQQDPKYSYIKDWKMGSILTSKVCVYYRKLAYMQAFALVVSKVYKR